MWLLEFHLCLAEHEWEILLFSHGAFYQIWYQGIGGESVNIFFWIRLVNITAWVWSANKIDVCFWWTSKFLSFLFANFSTWPSHLAQLALLFLSGCAPFFCNLFSFLYLCLYYIISGAQIKIVVVLVIVWCKEQVCCGLFIFSRSWYGAVMYNSGQSRKGDHGYIVMKIKCGNT